MQALYQWDLSGLELNRIETQFLENENFQGVDREYFTEILHQVPACLDEIEAGLAGSLNRPLTEVDPVERSILRIAAYELILRPDIPCRVVINEAVQLARKFGADQGHAFINGVLDHAARTIRKQEMKTTGKSTV